MNQVTDTSGIYGPWQDVGTITVQAISPAAITLSPTTPAATILPGNSVTIPVTVSTTLVNVETPILNVTGFPIGISFTSSAVYVYPGNPATSTVTAQVSAGVAPGVYNGTLTVTLCSVFNCQSVFNSQAVPLTISVVAPGSNSIAAFSLPPQGQSCKSTGYYIYTDGVPRTYCYQIEYGSSSYLDYCSLSDPSINLYFTPYTGNNFAITYAASTTTAHGSPTLSCEWSGAPTYIAPNAATISVYDATPAVTGMSINPNSPVAPTQFTVVLSGVGFGSTASANTPTLSISPAASYTITAHSPTSVTASITPSGGGNYSIQLVSLGNGNGGFSSGGNPASSNTSNVSFRQACMKSTADNC